MCLLLYYKRCKGHFPFMLKGHAVASFLNTVPRKNFLKNVTKLGTKSRKNKNKNLIILAPRSECRALS